MSSVTKTEKDKQKLVQEKCQVILTDMLRDEDNKYCVDCDAKGPRWASWNLGIFLCIRCAGIHRNLGVHISRVKSVNLDSWTPEQVTSLQQMGNSRARAVYEANLPDNFRRPQTDSALENFIRAKYEAKKYIAKEWVPQPTPKVCWDAEIEQELKRKKDAKRKTGNSPGAIELPAPVAVARARSTSSERKSLPSASTQTKQSQQPIPPLATTVTPASQDLLGLETVISTPKNEDFFGGLLDVSADVLPVNGAPSISTTTTVKSEDESSFFNQKIPTSTERKPLDKDSILALYNQSGNGPLQNVYSASGGSNLVGNVYGTPQPIFGQPSVMSGTSNIMAGGYNIVQNNLYTSPMFNTGGHLSGNPGPCITQFSQQMSGLSLGSSPMVRPTATFQTTATQGSTLVNSGSPVVNQVMNPATHAATQQTYNAFLSSGQSLSSNLWQ